MSDEREQHVLSVAEIIARAIVVDGPSPQADETPTVLIGVRLSDVPGATFRSTTTLRLCEVCGESILLTERLIESRPGATLACSRCAVDAIRDDPDPIIYRTRWPGEVY